MTLMKEVTLLLFIVTNALHSHGGSQTEAIHVSLSYGNVTQEFPSLQEAVDHAIVLDNSLSGIPTICLPQGHHRITKQMLLHESSIVMTGTQGTTIKCDYDPLPYEEGFHYTWHFNQSRLVHIESISFTSCPYPLRLIAVQNVTIRDCTFR